MSDDQTPAEETYEEIMTILRRTPYAEGISKLLRQYGQQKYREGYGEGWVDAQEQGE